MTKLKGIEKNTIQSICNLMKNLKLSIEQVIILLEETEADREKYARMIKQQNR